MRSLYLALLKYKDHVIFILAIALSLGILLKNDSSNIFLVRGKFSAVSYTHLTLPTKRIV